MNNTMTGNSIPLRVTKILIALRNMIRLLPFSDKLANKDLHIN